MKYIGETHNPCVPVNLLAYAMQCVDYAPGLVLLDSGGHMGYVEFQYVLQRLTAPTFIALDDINAGFDRLHAGEVVRLVVTF